MTPAILLSQSQIAHRIATMATEICAGMQKEFTVVSLLRGSFIFTADLMRALHVADAQIKLELDFITLASYGKGITSSGSRTPRHHHGVRSPPAVPAAGVPQVSARYPAVVRGQPYIRRCRPPIHATTANPRPHRIPAPARRGRPPVVKTRRPPRQESNASEMPVRIDPRRRCQALQMSAGVLASWRLSLRRGV